MDAVTLLAWVGGLGLAILLTWGLIAALLLLLGSRRPSSHDWDAIIVAGCQVTPDNQPSRALRARTLLAVELWKQGVAPCIVFTGGSRPPRQSEADVAASLALSQGVPDQAIVREVTSMTTLENAAFSANLISARRVLVVSDPYHVPRCRLLFLRYFSEVGIAGTPIRLRAHLRMALREVLIYATWPWWPTL